MAEQRNPVKAVVYTDGGARPTNPGHGGFGAVLIVKGNDYFFSRYLGRRVTNNQAEYTGVIACIKYASQLGATQILIVTDSKLVCEQINGRWQTKSAEMRVLCETARKLLDKHFPSKWAIKHVKGHAGDRLNEIADKLCTDAIHAGMNRNPFTPQKIKDKRGGRIRDPFVS